MVCPWFRIGGTVVRTIAMTARFDDTAEVTLDELRIELMYPLDDDADRFFRAHDGHARLLALTFRAPAAACREDSVVGDKERHQVGQRDLQPGHACGVAI